MNKLTHEEAMLNITQYSFDPQAARDFLRNYVIQQEEFEEKVKKFLYGSSKDSSDDDKIREIGGIYFEIREWVGLK